MGKYTINDVISYGSHGVCKIMDLTNNVVAGRQRQYYVLKPLHDNKATVFVPVDNPKLLNKFRPLLSRDDIYSLIDRSVTEKPRWHNEDTSSRNDYNGIFEEATLDGMLWMIKILHPKREERKSIGKRLCVTDENLMKKAEKILYGELSYVLNIESHEVWPFITNRLNQITN